jgi:hypothetical protein
MATEVDFGGAIVPWSPASGVAWVVSEWRE